MTPEAVVNLAIGLAGLLIGALSVYLAFRFRPRGPVLVARWVTYDIVGPMSQEPRFSLQSDSRLRITYDSVSVTRVGRAYVAIWNAGQAPVRREDAIAGGRGLAIKLDGAVKILGDIKFISTGSPLIGISTRVDPLHMDTVRADFTILEPGDGLLLEVLYEGDKVTVNLEADYAGLRGHVRSERNLGLKERVSFRPQFRKKIRNYLRTFTPKHFEFLTIYISVLGYAALWIFVAGTTGSIVLGILSVIAAPIVGSATLAALETADARRLNYRKRQLPRRLSYFP